MKISPVRNNVFYRQLNKNKPCQKDKAVIRNVNFEKYQQFFNIPNNFNYLTFQSTSINQTPVENPLYNYDFRDFIFQKGKVSLDEYKKLKQEHPELLELANNFVSSESKTLNINQKPKETAILSKKVQEWLDNTFGENGYILVSIGTSPAFLTESLSAMGKNVIFVPVSRANCLMNRDELEECFKLFPKVEVVAQYLKEELSKQNTENKTVVLMDYKVEGSTLKLFNSIVKNKCGIPQSQIYTCNIVKLIKDLICADNLKLSFENFRKDIGMQRAAFIANVAHYNIDTMAALLHHHTSDFEFDSEKVKYRNLQNDSTPLGRAYQLLVLDELEKMKSS